MDLGSYVYWFLYFVIIVVNFDGYVCMGLMVSNVLDEENVGLFDDSLCLFRNEKFQLW